MIARLATSFWSLAPARRFGIIVCWLTIIAALAFGLGTIVVSPVTVTEIVTTPGPVRTVTVEIEPTPSPWVHPLDGGSFYIIQLHAPIALTGNPESGEIECNNDYGRVTIIQAFGDSNGFDGRGITSDGRPTSTLQPNITATLDYCSGVGTWHPSR